MGSSPTGRTAAWLAIAAAAMLKAWREEAAVVEVVEHVPSRSGWAAAARRASYSA
jgi:hypothetical protein